MKLNYFIIYIFVFPYTKVQCLKTINEIKRNAEEFYETIPIEVREEAKLLAPDIIRKYGYPSETHQVETSDGYLLHMHRIPYGRFGPSKNRSPVLLQHGLLCSSTDWIISGPGKALAYLLADAGYDVWLGNNRGNTYSRNHTVLDPTRDASKFWKFSWHEMGMYDLPAMIDLVLEKTRQKQLFYVGYSQGNTAFYVMCSQIPSYNHKIRAHFSLAPMTYLRFLRSPVLRLVAPFQTQITFINKWFGLHEFLPNDVFFESVANLLCREDSVYQVLCTNALFVVGGFNRKQFNSTLLPVIMAHTPAGSSLNQLLHYGQSINSKKFQQWDYGWLKNRKIYGSIFPPRYNLDKVKAPVYLFYSRNDWMSGERDVLRLYRELGNVKGKFLVIDKHFNHLDYLYAIQANNLVYRKIINLMKKH